MSQNTAELPPDLKAVDLMTNPAFRAFWISRALSQAAQGATIYGLFVLLVDQTESAVANAAFVLCATIPSILFSLPGGLVADAIPRRNLLTGLNLIRVIFLVALAVREVDVPGIFAAALGFWIIHQFYSPSESATLSILVPSSRYANAQALSNLALTVAQVVGIALIAPLTLKTGEPRILFGLCALMMSVALIMVAGLPRYIDAGSRRGSEELPTNPTAALTEGMSYIRDTPIVRQVVSADALAGIGLSALIILAPLYLTGILGTSAENTVFVFAPAAIGLLIGLKTAPGLAKSHSNRNVAIWGLFFFAVCIALIGLLSQIYNLLEHTLHVPIDQMASTLHLAPMAMLVMIVSVPAGFFSSIVNVTARAALLQNTPENRRGRVVAAQSMVQNVLGLVPTIVCGILADKIGVEVVAVITAGLIASGAMALLYNDQLKAWYQRSVASSQ